ncbi:hypothetical protein MKW92_037286 [Papaver armeniacum]|nr:hypothetical protein MKW92_037286 [Papaver armeniacum]
MMCNSRIESGVRKTKNTARKSVGRTKKPVMIDPTTPEQARVNRMKRKGVILERKKQENTDLGSQSGSMDTVEHSTGVRMRGVRKKNGVIKSGGLNSNSGSDIGAHLEIEVVEHSTKTFWVITKTMMNLI